MVGLFKNLRESPALRSSDRPDVFLSYSRLDTAEAVKIAEALKEQNFTVWYDKDIEAGADWRQTIQRKMMRARCVVLYWSKRAERSWWVAYEVFTAQQLDKLIVTSFDDIGAGSAWAQHLHCVRLRKPLFKSFKNTDEWKRLVSDVEQKRKRLPRLKFKGWVGGGVAHKGGVTSVVFDPSDDGRLVSTGRDGRAYFWRAEETVGALSTVPNPDTGAEELSPAALPPADRCFDVGKPAGSDQPPWVIQRAAFSGDGRKLLLACEDGTVRVFEGAALTAPHHVLAHTRAVLPDYGGGRLGQNHRYAKGVIDAAVASTGEVLTFGGDAALVWSSSDAQTPVRRHVLPGGQWRRALDCLYSEASEAFFVSDTLGRIHRIDGTATLVEDALPPRARPGAAMGHVTGAIRERDDSIIATCSMSPGDRRIDVHRWTDGQFQRIGDKKTRADYPVRALAVHPDAPVIALAAGFRPSLITYDDANRIDTINETGGDHQQALTTIAISQTGRYIAAGGEDGCISIWEDETPRTMVQRGELVTT